MEIDITEKVYKIIKYCLICILFLVLGMSSIIYCWQKNDVYLVISDAQIQGKNVNIMSKVSGTVQDILVEDGAMVEAGQTIAILQVEISPEQIKELENNLENAKLHYNNILSTPDVITPSVQNNTVVDQASVESAQKNLDRAAANRDKMEKLFAMGAISAVQNNAAQVAYQAALDNFTAANTPRVNSTAVVNQVANKQELLRIAQLQIDQAKLAYEQSKSAQQSAVITAPVSGMVNLNSFTIDTKVQAGQNLFTVSDIADVWVEAKISRNDVYKVGLGNFSSYSITEYPRLIFKGTVFDIIGDEALEQVDDNMAILKISVPMDEDTVFKPGMRVNLKITL